MKLPLSLLLSLSLFACEDKSLYCGEDVDGNLIADDADCDNVLTADDCDDNDANSTTVATDADCDGTVTADDCDDTDDASTIMADDADCDTVLTTDDCDDNDPMSTVVAEDADCDGTVTADDCDDTDAMSTIVAEDGDCDGTVSAEDCDDADPMSTTIATDADCDTYITADDCDDNNEFAYPGTGANEAVQGVCYSDADGDGYGDSGVLAGSETLACYQLDMVDTYGDGWDGNAIEVYEDGVMTGSYTNDDSYGEDEVKTETHCVGAATTDVEFVFNATGIWHSEVEFDIYYGDSANGILIGSAGDGNDSNDTVDFTLEADGTTTTVGDGETLFTETSPTPNTTVEVYGTDCDDMDANNNPGIDADMDGFSTCDDCDDSDETINPDAEETYYDGVDQNCDGWSDFDADMDGSDSMEHTGSCSDTAFTTMSDCENAGTCSDVTYDNQGDCEANAGSWTNSGNVWTATGYDCDDTDEVRLALPTEADPTACYYDDDGDGFGDDTPSDYQMDTYGVVAGSDCYDYNDTVYPGAAYNEDDVDGDGVTDCTRDADGDGWGDSDPASYYNALAGTDCDDGDELKAPGLDSDADGTDSCDDCDDTDASVVGAWYYEDADLDGYGDMTADAELLCDPDTDGDLVADFVADNTDCDDGDALLNPGTDADTDGADACHDCDDNDGSVIGQEAYLDEDGDGFGIGNSEWVCSLDPDADGTDEYSVVGGDCYDYSWSAYAPYIYPGAAYNEADLDGDGNPDCSQDRDGDGWGEDGSVYGTGTLEGTDCDDTDDMLNNDDLDADGYASCADANGLSDCDDSDAYTFPGAGFNEAGFDAADLTTYECLTDVDGDGYAPYDTYSCYTFDLVDQYSAWEGGMNFEVFADGTSIGMAEVSGGGAETTVICALNGSNVEFVFNDGSYAQETSGTIYADDGTTVLGSFTGTGGWSGSATQSIQWDDGNGSVDYFDGDIFFTETAAGTSVVGGTDSDDSDASVQ